jgi:hypothetical protein
MRQSAVRTRRIVVTVVVAATLVFALFLAGFGVVRALTAKPLFASVNWRSQAASVSH